MVGTSEMTAPAPPCPFCGGPAVVEHEEMEDRPGGYRVRVRCASEEDGIPRCRVRTPNHHYLAAHRASATAGVLKIWTRRPAPPPRIVQLVSSIGDYSEYREEVVCSWPADARAALEEIARTENKLNADAEDHMREEHGYHEELPRYHVVERSYGAAPVLGVERDKAMATARAWQELLKKE